MDKQPLGTTAQAGQTCPESGLWRVVNRQAPTTPMNKGDLVPPFGGKAVIWQLIQHASK